VSRSAQAERASDWQGSAGEGGASGAGAAVWPPAIVKDARRALNVAFNHAALFMRQPFGSWPKLTRQSRKVMEITGARTCAAAELVLQLEGDWGPADDMQGYGWALLVGPADAWERFGL
jgi:hypothetical protein